MARQLNARSKIRNLTTEISLKVCFFLSVGCFTLLLEGARPGNALPYRMAVLQGIDKVTARVSTIKAPIDATIRFGALEIVVRHCDKRLPEELPESAAFMEIKEVRPSEAAVSLFNGWMLASSPALSALEHPVYDIWVLYCGGEKDSSHRKPKLRSEQHNKDVNLPGLQELLKKKINRD